METIAALQDNLRKLEARLAALERSMDPAFFTLEPETAPCRSRFTPPTDKDSSLEAARIGMDATEHTKWRNFYASNGWKVGRNPMKDWRAALRNWHLNARPVGKTLVQTLAASPSGAQIMVWNQEMDDVRKKIRDLTPDSNMELNDKDRAQMVILKARLKELKAKLGREF